MKLLATALFCVACTPPVLFPVEPGDWTLETSDYPRDSRLVTLERTSAPALRGLYVPGDEGAPLIVHFAESGGSIVAQQFTRGQYEDLSDLGFANLAIDYRGIGLSDGSPSPRAVDDDARAMYDHALELVDGDESRLVVRGTSLGTLAISSLLDDGARPAAIVLFAPVLSDSVAIRYGEATLWDPAVWLARPFLRSFIDTDLVETLREVECPLLVVGHERDELLSADEFRDLYRAVMAAKGHFQLAANLFNITFNGESALGPLEVHIGLAGKSYRVDARERALLVRRFPDVPDLAERRERVFADGDDDLVARVRADTASRERLDRLLRETRRFPADAFLAVAREELRVPEALRLLRQAAPQSWSRPTTRRSAYEYERFFDHTDPAGPLSTLATWAADFLIESVRTAPEASAPETASIQELLDLARLLDGEEVAGYEFDPERGLVTIVGHDSTPAKHLVATTFLTALDFESHAPDDRRRRMIRALLKAAHYTERVVETDRGPWVEVESPEGVVWIDPSRLCLGPAPIAGT